MLTSSEQQETNKQIYRTWMKPICLPSNATLLDLYVQVDDEIIPDQPLFQYKLKNIPIRDPLTNISKLGEKTGVYLASIYKNLKSNTLCKSKIISILPDYTNINDSSTNKEVNVTEMELTLPLEMKRENTIILLIEYIDENVKESITKDNFEPQSNEYTLI
ncbi:hypothetical protein ABK040_011295 [Willaertia magna]